MQQGNVLSLKQFRQVVQILLVVQLFHDHDHIKMVLEIEMGATAVQCLVGIIPSPKPFAIALGCTFPQEIVGRSMPCNGSQSRIVDDKVPF